MVNKYQTISIIYGGSGRRCAEKIRDHLNRKHFEDRLPIRTFILAEEYLSSGSILNTVTDVIGKSQACIIILTFDDINGTRVRQNVLIEIGMAMMQIKKENCFFISEKKELPPDFPSDLKNEINANYFDMDHIEDQLGFFCDTIFKALCIKDYKNILNTDHYIFDYKRILDDIPESVFNENANLQLKHILREWETNISNFTFVAEKIMYLLERIKFFPNFNNDTFFFDFLDKVEAHITLREEDEQFGDINALDHICDFVKTLLEYTRVKLNKNFLQCANAPETNKTQLTGYKYQFLDIAENLKSFIEWFSSEPEHACNWLIQVLAYEYVGLAYMKYIQCNNVYDETILELLDHVTDAYNKAVQIGKAQDRHSKTLWEGYTEYNLTRVYETKYRITKDTKFLAHIEKYSHKSMISRRKWYQQNQFRGIFSSALSLEYFLVCKYEYELNLRHPAYCSGEPETVIKDLQRLKKEISGYCDNTGLGRLYEMRNEIDTIIRNYSLKKES